METGRRDGLVSNLRLADDMPDVNDSVQKLKQKFFDKGLTDKDLVVLSGEYCSAKKFTALFLESI